MLCARRPAADAKAFDLSIPRQQVSAGLRQLIDCPFGDLGCHGGHIGSILVVAKMAGNQLATAEANMRDTFRCREWP